MPDATPQCPSPRQHVLCWIKLITLFGLLVHAVLPLSAAAQSGDKNEKQPVYELKRLELPSLAPLIEHAKKKQGDSAGAKPRSAPGGAVGSRSLWGSGDVYLYVEGVPGPGTHSNYPGWVPLLGMREEVASGGGASGGAAGRSTSSPLTVMKPVDSASVPLRRAAASGQQIPLAVVVFLAKTKSADEVYRLVLENVRVVRVATRLHDEKVVEEMDLTYQRVTWRFTLHFQSGEAGAALEQCWDFKSNSGC